MKHPLLCVCVCADHRKSRRATHRVIIEVLVLALHLDRKWGWGKVSKTRLDARETKPWYCGGMAALRFLADAPWCC